MLDPLISPLSIAPMIDWTYSHFRFFMRLIAPNALLYTEMQTIGAIKNNSQRALAYHPEEHPLALQLGGSDIRGLVYSAQAGEEQGFAEINLNLGCPSDKVKAGRFGACLMAEPQHVSECLAAIKKHVTIPVTAKTRIGIDHQDSYEFFANFAKQLVQAGSDKLIVHARKAWLNGLSPKQNRSIPPVNYDFVYRIKQELSAIPIVINGNINTVNDITQHMSYVDGVMLGRIACQNPYALASIHQYFYPETPIPKRGEILIEYANYLRSQFEQGIALGLLLKPIFNLAHGLPKAKLWKEALMRMQQSKKIDELDDSTALISALD